MNYEGATLCGVKEVAALSGGMIRKWPDHMTTLRWTLVGSFHQFDDDIAIKAAAEAWNNWAEVCGLRFEYAEPNDPRGVHVPLDVGRIDGPNGVLAQAYLADGTERPKNQLADSAERWAVSANAPSDRVDLVAVLCHESGHSLGIEHLSPGALMQPTYQPGLRTPQQEDIQQAQLRYGKPKPKPVSPVPGVGGRLVIEFENARVIEA